MNNSDERDYEEEKANELLMQENDTEQKQIVWRSYSETESCGYFVWEVLEYVGEPDEYAKKWLTECRDGSYIVQMCYHFWIKESARDTFDSGGLGSEYQVVHKIGNSTGI